MNGNYEMAEMLMDQAINGIKFLGFGNYIFVTKNFILFLDGYLESYMKSQSYKPIWNLVKEFDNAGTKRPCMRGGHQMCIDSATGNVYLLGGWNGHKDLSDLWSFNIATGIWHCITTNVEKDVIYLKEY